MDNFNFKQYLSENRIHADHDLIKEKKEDSKKGNKEEQKRMEGAIRDNEIHIDKLNRDKKADKKKLAKLKADEPKDVSEVQGYVDRENESDAERLGSDTDSAGVGSKRHKEKDERDLSYGKFGKRDAEKKGKNKVNKEEVEIDESAIAVAAGVASIFGGAVAADKAMDALEAGKLGEKGKAFAAFLRSQGKAAAGRYDEGVEEGYGKPMYDEDDINPMKEDEATDKEQEGYEDGFKDAKKDMKDAMSKMKISELKAKIREDILSTLNEVDEEMDPQDRRGNMKEDEEVDVDIDVEDEVKVDAEADDIEIERKGVKAKIEVGLSPEEEIIQDSLKAAMDSANALGNDKLADQIGNTITFFTREYVVGDRS